jgi:hypothetical protein
MKLKDFQKAHDSPSVTVIIQVYELSYQCLPSFHQYLIGIERFNNFLLTLINDYDVEINTIKYKKLKAR